MLFTLEVLRVSLHVVSPSFSLTKVFGVFFKGSLLWCCLIREFLTYAPAVATQNWQTAAGGGKMTSLGSPQDEMRKLTLDAPQKEIHGLPLDTSQRTISNPVTPLSFQEGTLLFYIYSTVVPSEGCCWELCITQVFEGECHRWYEELMVFRNCAVNKWTGLLKEDGCSVSLGG